MAIALERDDAADEPACGLPVARARPAYDPDQRGVALVEHRAARSPLQTPRPELAGFFDQPGSAARAWRSVATSVAMPQCAGGLGLALGRYPESATMKRSPNKPARAVGRGAGLRLAGEAASLTSARSWNSPVCSENCGCGTTRATSLTDACLPSNVTNRYLPLASTQCAAVSTRSEAIAAPLQGSGFRSGPRVGRWLDWREVRRRPALRRVEANVTNSATAVMMAVGLRPAASPIRRSMEAVAPEGRISRMGCRCSNGHCRGASPRLAVPSFERMYARPRYGECNSHASARPARSRKCAASASSSLALSSAARS